MQDKDSPSFYNAEEATKVAEWVRGIIFVTFDVLKTLLYILLSASSIIKGTVSPYVNVVSIIEAGWGSPMTVFP